MLLKKSCLFLPALQMRLLRTKEEQHQVLIACHNKPKSGHFGIIKTMERVSERFYWKGMVADCKRYGES